MKISELITKLEEQKEHYGDLPLMCYDTQIETGVNFVKDVEMDLIGSPTHLLIDFTKEVTFVQNV